MKEASSEIKILEALLPNLEEEGFKVFIHPQSHILPTFLKGFRPDAVAIYEGDGARKNLVIEVVHKSNKAEEKVSKLRALFEGQEKWELRIYWVADVQERKRVTIQERKDIMSELSNVSSLISQQQNKSALILSWACFEATARLLHPSIFERAQTPRRVLDRMAQEGYLIPDDADFVRALVDKRNRIVHGDFKVEVSNDEVKKFFEVLHEVLTDND